MYHNYIFHIFFHSIVLPGHYNSKLYGAPSPGEVKEATEDHPTVLHQVKGPSGQTGHRSHISLTLPNISDRDRVGDVLA